MKLHDNKIVLIGIGIALVWWVLESVIHVVVFGEDTFVQNLFFPPLHELWMRALTLVIIIIFGIAAQISFNRQQQTEEKKVRESHAELDQIFQTAADGMRVVDKDFNVLRTNDTFLKLAGIRSDEVAGRKCYKVFSGPLCHTPDCPLTRILAGEKYVEDEVEKVRADGKKIPCIVTATPFRDPGGNVIGIVEDFRDITERKRAEKEMVRKNEDLHAAYEQLTATEEELRQNYDELSKTERELRQSEMKYRTLAEASPDQIFIVGRDDTMKYANAAALKMFRLPYDQVVGKPRKDLFPPEIANAQGILLKKIFETGEHVQTEEKIRFGTQELWIDTSSVPLKDETGNVTSVLGIARDITGRRRMEDALRESEKKYRDLVELLPQTVFELDEKGTITTTNSTALKSFGYTQEDLDEGLSGFQMLASEDRNRARENIQRVLNGDLLGGNEYTALKKDGSTFPVIIYTDAIIHDMKPVGIRGILVDITELKRAENALNRATRKLNMLNSIVLTDIQNAVFSLSGYFELEKLELMDEKIRGFMDKQTGIIQAISESLKFAKNYQDLGLRPPAWQNVTQSFLMGISHMDISGLSRKLNVEGLEIYADPLLENIFFALAENVVLHGKTATEIALFYQKTRKGLILVFEDNGAGIPDDMKEKIFDRRYVGKKGMGLYLAREILSITGITIQETGAFGKGARFEITVPEGAYRFIS